MYLNINQLFIPFNQLFAFAIIIHYFYFPVSRCQLELLRQPDFVSC